VLELILSFDVWDEAVDINMDLTIPPHTHHSRECFGPLLVTFLVTQNLVSIVVCQFKRVKGRSAARQFCPWRA
jgi:hypothetical protein